MYIEMFSLNCPTDEMHIHQGKDHWICMGGTVLWAGTLNCFKRRLRTRILHSDLDSDCNVAGCLSLLQL